MVPAKTVLRFLIVLCAASGFAQEMEIRDVDVSAWPCLNQPSGTAKTPDGIERNAMKNRAPVDLAGKTIERLDTTGFLKKVAAYDAELRAHRRNELSESKKRLLEGFQNQLVSLTGYLMFAYPGPPETCNCGDRNLHDWHLELFENSSDHAPQVGDPTPIICEITPRTEQLLYRSGVRLQSLAGFFRSGKQYTATSHPPQLVKVTGFLMWDDEHNGSADVGTHVQNFTPGNGFHHPWRSTAWEIHPIVSIEAVSTSTAQASAAPQQAKSQATPLAVTSKPTATPPETVSITTPLRIKIPYGETVIPAGTHVEVVSRSGDSVTVRYLGALYAIPRSATDR